MVLYEILKASKLGAGAAPDMYTALFAQRLNKGGSGGEAELSGVPPLTFRSNGTPLIDYLISGNTTQSGTPTHENPVMPQGTGDLETAGDKTGQYKIPISSASTTTPVYLGEVETTRRIKKLVFEGTENWRLYALPGATNVERFYLVVPQNAVSARSIISSHFPTKIDNSDTEHTRCGGGLFNEIYIYISRSVATTAADLKSYLAAQYAAGTPVTVWYALATPETGIVNEPLMKIGNYADTLSKAQAGVSIPTNNGSTTVDVDTTVKPSEVYIKYRT